MHMLTGYVLRDCTQIIGEVSKMKDYVVYLFIFAEAREV